MKMRRNERLALLRRLRGELPEVTTPNPLKRMRRKARELENTRRINRQLEARLKK